jgi:DNA/RNA-binding domain of Phe-tRNA-synthetase-like protein
MQIKKQLQVSEKDIDVIKRKIKLRLATGAATFQDIENNLVFQAQVPGKK